MSAAAVACPTCRTALQPGPSLRPSQTVQCSRCGTRFALPPSLGVTPRPAVAVVAAPVHPVAVSAPAPAAALQADGARWPILLAVGGGVALLVLLTGITLAAVLIRGGRAETPAAERPPVGAPVEARREDRSDSPTLLPLAPAGDASRPRGGPGERQPPRDERPELARPLTTLPEAEQRKVDQAIDKGVAYLKRSQGPDGVWPLHGPLMTGYSALPGLTLLECGVPADDPAVQAAAACVREHCPGLVGTYELALAVLFLDRLGDPKDHELIQQLALRIVAGQNGDGGWSYNCKVLSDEDYKDLFAALEASRPASPGELFKPITLQRPGGLGLVPADEDRPGERKEMQPARPPARRGAKRIGADRRGPVPPALREPLELTDETPFGRSDNSNSQFAILALWAAQRHGVPLERCLALVVKRYQATQNPDGGWGYTAGQGSAPAMTCVGLLGMAVGHGLARDPAAGRTKDPMIEKGLEHLGRYIEEPQRGRGRRSNQSLYYLWSLERVGVLYGLPKIVDKDWYAWGAGLLVAQQHDDGSWLAGHYHAATPPINTAFALLFLKRANLAKDLTKKLDFLIVDTPGK